MTISTDIVKWTEILSVEDELLDEQHKKLFDLTNNLLWHYKNKDNLKIVNESLDVLVEYCVEHFEYEENILKSRNYPKLDSHIKAHEDFKEKIDFFRKSASNGNGNIIDSMIIYLIGWIKNHTYYDDLDYKNYL